MRHTISVLVENKFGVLTRVAGLFSGRGYNIDTLNVAPTADQISGVVSYYATIVLNGGDPRLKDGQTAQAVVRTEFRENVLRVPTAAVRQDSGGSVVTVPGADGSTTTTFTPGLSGDEFTEVQSGLTEGQRVLLPSPWSRPPPEARGGDPAERTDAIGEVGRGS